MNIFISSTVYDLIDLRSEVYSYLTELGFSVKVSDIDISDFKLFQDRSAIEICLENVRQSDFIIFILDRRYGNTIDYLGYPNISVTQLEYEEAKKNSKHILFYIRDKTIAEYFLFQRNKKNFDTLWIEKKEIKIFEFIELHEKNTSKN